MDVGVVTPPEHSIVFFMDADMVAYPGLMQRVLSHVEEGRVAFAPVSWSGYEYSHSTYAAPGRSAYQVGSPSGSMPATGEGGAPQSKRSSRQWYEGTWRSGGTGMIAFYYSDFLKAGGCVPMADRTAYGHEDHEFVMLLMNQGGLSVKRECTPELWHLFHPKNSWELSLDGIVLRNGNKEPIAWDPALPWKLEAPHPNGVAVLQEHGDLNGYRCMRQKNTLYA